MFATCKTREIAPTYIFLGGGHSLGFRRVNRGTTPTIFLPGERTFAGENVKEDSSNFVTQHLFQSGSEEA